MSGIDDVLLLLLIGILAAGAFITFVITFTYLGPLIKKGRGVWYEVFILNRMFPFFKEKDIDKFRWLPSYKSLVKDNSIVGVRSVEIDPIFQNTDEFRKIMVLHHLSCGSEFATVVERKGHYLCSLCALHVDKSTIFALKLIDRCHTSPVKTV